MTQKELYDILETSYQEVVNIDSSRMLLLNVEYEKKNPIAIEIKKYLNDLLKYYLNCKSKILDGTIISPEDINFDSVPKTNYTIDDLETYINEEIVSNYKIAPYVDIQYTDSRIHLVDFKRHLKPNIALDKKVYKDNKGRPTKAEYYYNDELMAVIYFVFETDDNNFITRRTEKLRYILNNGTEGMEIIIKDKHYDMTCIEDATIVLAERVTARKYIVESINIFTLGVLAQYNPDKTQLELIAITLPYLEYSKQMIDNFINYGATQWRDDLINMDLNTTEYSFMSYIIDNNGTTLRDYIVSKLTY